MIAVVKAMGPTLGYAPTCAALGLARATFYRHVAQTSRARLPRRKPTQTLSPDERGIVLATLHEDRFVALSPTEVFAQLLDEGNHLCSIRTMYRVLEENAEVRDRRRQRCYPAYAKPELLATGPRQV